MKLGANLDIKGKQSFTRGGPLVIMVQTSKVLFNITVLNVLADDF